MKEAILSQRELAQQQVLHIHRKAAAHRKMVVAGRASEASVFWVRKLSGIEEAYTLAKPGAVSPVRSVLTITGSTETVSR